MHKYGFAPNLYGVFLNGLAYEYVPGVTLTPDTVIQSNIWPVVAKHMAEMHKVKYDNADVGGVRKAMLWDKTQSFLNLVPETFSDANKHDRYVYYKLTTFSYDLLFV